MKLEKLKSEINYMPQVSEGELKRCYTTLFYSILFYFILFVV
jgi:hypothetical protein